MSDISNMNQALKNVKILEGKFGKEIYVEDSQGGYTAFFASIPSIVVEGKTIEDAQRNLWNATFDILRSLINNLK